MSADKKKQSKHNEDGENSEKEIDSSQKSNRRVFLSNVGRYLIGGIGALLMYPTEAKANCGAGCYMSCLSSCTGTCYMTCDRGCLATCYNTCQTSCMGTCAGTCIQGCANTCTNTCIQGCANTCIGGNYYNPNNW